MATLRPYRRPAAFLLIFCLLHLVRSQPPLNTSMTYTNLTQVFPELNDLYTTHLTRSINAGGQNLTRCCLLAVNASYVLQGGQPIQNPNPDDNFVDLPAANLTEAQFPCGATYDGNPAGAPPVIIPYSWCKQNCGGWERSSNAVLSQWVQPFVGFILPAAVFCLNVRTLCNVSTKQNNATVL